MLILKHIIRKKRLTAAEEPKTRQFDFVSSEMVHVLRFTLEAGEKLPKKTLLTMPLFDLIEESREIRIFIDDRLYFETPYFPIREFVKYALDWEEQLFKKDFVYNTVDDYQNPLLAFHRWDRKDGKDRWKIQSVWQKFDCQKLFTQEEVEAFVNEIVDRVVE